MFLLETYDEIKQQKSLSSEQKDILEAGKTDIKAVTVSELLEIFSKKDAIVPIPSSWSTTKEDLAKGDPYPLWDSKTNEAHKYQWRSLRICIDMVKKALEVADNDESRKYARIARLMLDRAEHSDQFWWASKKPWYDINMIAKGMQEHYLTAINAYRAIRTSTDCSEEVNNAYYEKVIVEREYVHRVSDSLFL